MLQAMLTGKLNTKPESIYTVVDMFINDAILRERFRRLQDKGLQE